MKNKKGFTLIELLAVIVILAVIALIATPLIMGTITKAKKNAFVDTAYGIIKAGENYQTMNNFENEGKIDNLFIDNLNTDNTLKYKGARPKSGQLFINSDGKSAIAMWSGQFCAQKKTTEKDVTVKENIKNEKDCMNLQTELFTLKYEESSQEFSIPLTGNYQIELWGAAGGKGMQNNHFVYKEGNGAYTSGTIHLTKGDKLYFYIGGKGNDANVKVGGLGGYNGGSAGGPDSDNDAAGGGGGATDVRLVSGSWNDFNSLKSRIMVAAGGGASSYRNPGAPGGALQGQDSSTIQGENGLGATQTRFYFGYSEDGDYCSGLSEGIAGSGGGYYGTKKSVCGLAFDTLLPGSSSFISGYTGCDAIANTSTESNIVHTGQANHYSGKVFTNGVMIDGSKPMPNPNGSGNMTGNEKSGYARITLLSVN